MMSILVFLGSITSLTHLNLSQSAFTEEIPPQIGNLSNLVYLDLSSNFLIGTIPSQMGNLSNLRYLDLSSISLLVENVDWLSSLSKLEYLDLGDGDLSKSLHLLHTLQALPSLMQLHLSWCTLPPHYSQPPLLNFSSLLTLDMSRVSGISYVPNWIFGLEKLVSLTLNNNDIHSPFPDGIQNLTLLQNLDLSYNSFSSSIPHSLYGLQCLKLLNLANNDLQGTIVDALGNLTSLIELDLSYNELDGKIPTSLGNACNLRDLRFSHLKLNQQVNEITEILAPCISHVLTTLVASSSQLSGNLTNQFGVFENIVALDFSNNTICGKLPRSFGKLSSLEFLDLSKNQFSRNPFEYLGSFSKLLYLDISDNHFQGVVNEDGLTNLTSLKEFYANGVNLSLRVSSNWLPSFQLTNLYMSFWQLGPSFPSWLQSQKKLEYIDLSNTCISDSIPTWFWKAFSKASYLNLTHNHIHGELVTTIRNPISIDIVDLSTNHLRDFQSNHFTGNLPLSMGYLVDLQSLSIRNNSFSGIFPTMLKENNQLIFLDLGENNFSGAIPAWIGERLLKIKFLRLRSNKFSGHISNKICGLIVLQDLDLAQNNLFGNIPNCFNHLNAMSQKNKSRQSFIYPFVHRTQPYAISVSMLIKGRSIEYKSILGLVTNVDLSHNNLSGEIPREITDLDGLSFLNLSNNQLSGQIPSSIGNMRSLESIDISRNQLSGEIPLTISNLNFLTKLDLSHNHLKGKIPPGTQIQSFEASNFVGNNLCGPPLPVNCSKVPVVEHIGTEDDGHGVNWFFVGMALGFVVGFWIVVAPLFISRSWRYVYFRFFDDMWYKLQSYCDGWFLM
ncbi:hypothetical protein Fmac_015882 [Flemingia macrophylla]|uniref:Disease resistance R13L4/SHOC-2-like LRR domain-containing protein n=1 Tax=Flemingia macrophylla TaxID=520843 RepID=A0ABD1MFZ7_9FABA